MILTLNFANMNIQSVINCIFILISFLFITGDIMVFIINEFMVLT